MSYTLYVGKNLTINGMAYIAGYGDEPSSHYLEIIPQKSYPEGAMIEVGVTEKADMPGLRSEIPQVIKTARHIRTSYSCYLGVPAPITNGGLNEYGVAVRDVWSPSRPELIEMTPKDQTGPNYSDLARIVIERATTAREGVEIIGELVEKYGESSYGGNSHFIADPNEAWVVIEFAGNNGLWVAERLGANSIRASRPGYIEDVDFKSENFLYSKNLVSFAKEMGWYDPNQDKSFNANKIYGDGKGRWAGVKWIETEIAKRANRPEKISIKDMMWAVRTETLTGDTAGYGQVVPLYHPKYNDLRHIWHTQIGAVAASFVPFYMGCQMVQEEFCKHRYLTVSEASRFVDDRQALEEGEETISTVPQAIEATRSANAVFKRLLYLVFLHPDKFLPEITEVFLALEDHLLTEQPEIIEIAEVLCDAGKKDKAQNFLTKYSNAELLKALNLAEAMANSIEARIRILYGLDREQSPTGPVQIW